MNMPIFYVYLTIDLLYGILILIYNLESIGIFKLDVANYYL